MHIVEAEIEFDGGSVSRYSENSNCDSGYFYIVYWRSPTFDNHFKTTTSTIIKPHSSGSSTMVRQYRISHDVRADEISKSQFILINNRACRVTSITFSPTSHNTPTLHILGTDITIPSKPRSFFENPQQTHSLHCNPRALVPVPEIEFIRGDRLEVGDFVTHGELVGHIKSLNIFNVGLKQRIHATVIQPLDRQPTKGVLWDDEMVQAPKLDVTEFRLRCFPEPQVVEFENDGTSLNVAQVENRELARQIEIFWNLGMRNVWVRVALGGVIGAIEVRELEVNGLNGEWFLALKGREQVPDMIIKRPMGVIGDKIAGFLKERKRFMVRIKAPIWHDENREVWTVDGVRAL